jgi:hypothetical protein
MPTVATTAVTAGPMLKEPADERQYYMDWTKDLAPDELIASVDAAEIVRTNVVFAGDGDDLVIDPASLQPNAAAFPNSKRQTVAIGKAALFIATAGVDGTDYYVKIRITTTLGNELNRNAWFQVRLL